MAWLKISEYNNYGDTNPSVPVEPGSHQIEVQTVKFGSVSEPLHKDTRLVAMYADDKAQFQFLTPGQEPDKGCATPMSDHYEITRIVHMGAGLRIAVWKLALIAALLLKPFFFGDVAHAQVAGLGPSQMWTVTQSGADTSSSNVAFTPQSSNKLTYVCGFAVTGGGATAATPVTVTLGPMVGNVTKNYTYDYALGAGVGNLPLVVTFTPCLPANAAGAAITLTVPGAAGNTNNTLDMYGYQQ